MPKLAPNSKPAGAVQKIPGSEAAPSEDLVFSEPSKRKFRK